MGEVGSFFHERGQDATTPTDIFMISHLGCIRNYWPPHEGGFFMSKTKKRHWACVVYPDSAPADWQDKLRATGLACAISPLHDADMNADETQKKPHWHVILCWPGPTTYAVAKGIADSLHSPIPQPLESVRGYYRYLTHKDNPEKVQYNERDIVCINGFSITDFVELTRSEISGIKRELTGLIRSLGITEYGKLIIILENGDYDVAYYDVASTNTIFFNTYITSIRHMAMAEAEAVRSAATARKRDEQDSGLR